MCCVFFLNLYPIALAETTSRAKILKESRAHEHILAVLESRKKCELRFDGNSVTV